MTRTVTIALPSTPTPSSRRGCIPALIFVTIVGLLFLSMRLATPATAPSVGLDPSPDDTQNIRPPPSKLHDDADDAAADERDRRGTFKHALRLRNPKHLDPRHHIVVPVNPGGVGVDADSRSSHRDSNDLRRASSAKKHEELWASALLAGRRPATPVTLGATVAEQQPKEDVTVATSTAAAAASDDTTSAAPASIDSTTQNNATSQGSNDSTIASVDDSTTRTANISDGSTGNGVDATTASAVTESPDEPEETTTAVAVAGSATDTEEPAQTHQQQQQKPEQTAAAGASHVTKFEHDSSRDQLPALGARMSINIDKAHRIISNDALVAPLPVDSTVEDAKAEFYTDKRLSSTMEKLAREPYFLDNFNVDNQASNTSRPTMTESRETFVRIVSNMFELFPGITTTETAYARPYLRWKLNAASKAPRQRAPSSSFSAAGSSASDDKQQQQQQQPARIACLYAGFMRDYEHMLRSCFLRGKGCVKKKFRRRFGYQWERLIEPLDCDVFISTWNIRGGGRYDTTTYDPKQTLPRVNHILGKYLTHLAAIHVHNYTNYDRLWHSAHRFKRRFPQIVGISSSTSSNNNNNNISPNLAGNAMNNNNNNNEQVTRMFPHRNLEPDNPFMRLNDYSQSFKHYCVMILTWQYETWARGSYDLYFRMRTDVRVVRIYRPMPTVAWKPALQILNGVNSESAEFVSKRNAAPLTRQVSVEVCPGPKFGNIAATPPAAAVVAGKAAAPGKAVVASPGDAVDHGGTADTEGAGAAAAADDGGKASCDRHLFTAATHPAHERSLLSLSKLPDPAWGLQRLAVNNYDISDFAYIGAPEMIQYVGAKMWNLCIAAASSPNPAFASGLVQKHFPAIFSEYNLMMWRLLLNGVEGIDDGNDASSVATNNTNNSGNRSSNGNTKKQQSRKKKNFATPTESLQTISSERMEIGSLFNSMRISRGTVPGANKKGQFGKPFK